MLSICLIGCGLLYISEWYYTQARYQDWLQDNDLRVDWGRFNSPAQAREAILRKISTDTSEKKLQDFYLTNVEGATIDGWYVKSDSGYYWLNGKQHRAYCPNSQECVSVKIEMPLIKSGHFFQRYLADRWIIFFYLDPHNHTLIDVQVQEIGVFERAFIGLVP